jgi:hypothetical protein
MDIKEQTRNVAAQGRYGDSMLLHVNPAEVKGLSQALPITVNPQTGQPEAFLPFIAPFVGSYLGKMAMGKALGMAAAGAIGGGLAQYAVTGDLKQGLLAGLSSFGVNKGIEALGAEGAKQTTQAAVAESTKQATDQANLYAANAAQPASVGVNPSSGGLNPTDIAQAGGSSGMNMTADTYNPTALDSPVPRITTQDFVNRVAPKSAQFKFDKIMGTDDIQKGIVQASESAGAIAPSSSFDANKATGMENFKSGFGITDDQPFGTKNLKQGAGNILKAAASPMAAGPFAVGAGGSSILESQRQFDEQTQDRLNSYIAGKRQNFADNPEVSLYTPNYSLSSPSFSASGGVTGYQEGGMTDYTNVAPDVPYIDNSLPIATKQLLSQTPSLTANAGVFAPARTLFDYNPNFQPGFSPETMYFDPNTINAPTIASQDGPPNLIDSYSGSAGGFDSANLTQAPLSSIDPFQSYTGIAPQGIEKLSNITPSTLNPYENINTASMGNILSPTNVNAAQPVATTNTFMPNQPSASFNPAQPFVDTSIIAPPVNQPNLGQVVTAAGGGETLPNKGLEALNKVAPDVVEKMGYNEGGLTPPEAMMLQEMMPQEMMNEGIMSNPNNDPLVNQTVAFILGELDDQNIINQFIEKYGNEKFLSLRNEVLQSLVPNAQTEGLIAGNGNGGMDDDLRGTIGNQERIAVSQDEFIVPADVVSMLGDGSSEAGSNELYAMMDRVRKEKTGTTEQAPKLANAGGMLPG